MTSPHTGWKTAQSLTLDGLHLDLSEPVLVARDKNYLWFPTLIELSNGNILARMSGKADEESKEATYSQTRRSDDRGRSWHAMEGHPNIIGHIPVRLPDNDEVLLPYRMRQTDDGMSGPCTLFHADARTFENIADGIRITGMPKKDQVSPLGQAGFVFDGRALTDASGTYLATLYGHFAGEKRYSVILLESEDARNWRFRSIIANSQCPLEGVEGPCEPVVCRMPDGRLMCVFRLSSFVPYGQSFSRDEGRSWTEPVNIPGCFSVEPSLAVVQGRIVALAGGRAGLFVWFNADGTGTSWQGVDMVAHHNACRTTDTYVPDLDRPWSDVEDMIKRKAFGYTTSYTELLTLDASHLLYIYDRVPCGWNRIPPDVPETNSIWVVRMTVSATPNATAARSSNTPAAP